MISGEEKVIGGLFVNEEINVRQGIPFLKDLPWWFFGIRYLTGYERKQISKKEVIILLQAELVPTLKERVAQRKENEIDNQIIEDHENLKKYKITPFREDEKKGIENK
jgi:type IV pilus assembly protein PilQ